MSMTNYLKHLTQQTHTQKRRKNQKKMFGTNSGRVVIDLLDQRSSRSQWILRNKSRKVMKERKMVFVCSGSIVWQYKLCSLRISMQMLKSVRKCAHIHRHRDKQGIQANVSNAHTVIRSYAAEYKLKLPKNMLTEQ